MKLTIKKEILGTKLNFIFTDSLRVWNNIHDSERDDGFFNARTNTIGIFCIKFKDNKYDDYFWEQIYMLIWHEVGHFVEHHIPNAIKNRELVSSSFEYIPRVHKEVLEIFKQLKAGVK